MSAQDRSHPYDVVLGVHLSEKSDRLGERHNQYAFRVAAFARKPDIRKAVEQLFKVEVRSVRVLNAKGRVRRARRGPARSPDWKKAYVTLAAGDAIDLSAVAL